MSNDGGAGCGIGMIVLVIGLIAALMFGIGYLNETAAEKHNARAHLEYTRAQAEAMRSDARANEARAHAEANALEMRTAAQSFAERVGAAADAFSIRTTASANAFATKVLGVSEATSITVTSITAAALPWMVALVALTLIAVAFLAWNARQQGGYYDLPLYRLPDRFRYPSLPGGSVGKPPIIVVLPQPGQSRREAYQALELAAAQPMLSAGEEE